MDDIIQEIRMYVGFLASLTTVIVFLGVSLKPVRRIISKWIGELFTADIKEDMNKGFEEVSIKMTSAVAQINKDRIISTRRHNSNLKELQGIKKAVIKVESRIDEHETDRDIHRGMS